MSEQSQTGPERWFLALDERANPSTRIDQRHLNGRAWTSANTVSVHVDGAKYFARLAEVLHRLAKGDEVWFTDWQGDHDERLVEGGGGIGEVLSRLEQRGVEVRGLLWSSHPRQAGFSAQENLAMTRDVNRDGGELVLDERVRRAGSHHQKVVIVHRSDRTDIAFVGGVDLCHGRRDDRAHHGDPQPYEMDERYGPTPAWHDVQLELQGPGVDDVSWTFRERWEDPHGLHGRSPVRALRRLALDQPLTLSDLPAEPPRSDGHGSHHVQVLRTYPFRRPSFGFAPEGERSIARAWLKAIGRARRLIAIEDQYLWSTALAHALADALRSRPNLRVVVVVPRYPDEAGRLSAAASNLAQGRSISILRGAAADRVAFYDLENEAGTPIYVHAKVAIIDDVWLKVGSDNLNRRSWTHDSELAAAVIDETRDEREPIDPGGLGDGARVLARATRLRLWREHLGREDGDDEDLVDPATGFDTLHRAALGLDTWVRAGRLGPRPPGRLRPHQAEPVPKWLRPASALAYHLAVDPDGRSLKQRAKDTH